MATRHLNRREFTGGVIEPGPIRKLRRYPVKSTDGLSTVSKLARGLNNTLAGSGSGSGPFCCPCIHCYLGTTPSSWTITATGITLVTPSCCVNFLSLIAGTGGVIRTMPTLSWNTTFTLDIYSEATSFGCDCQWASAYRDSVSFFYGTSACCAAPLDFSTSSAFRWILTRDKTFWALVLLADQGSAGSGVEIPIFYNKIPVDSKDGECESMLTFTNQLLACPGTPPCGDNVGLSQTGTVVCTPHP